jgi:flagellar basal body-associated protein FliL
MLAGKLLRNIAIVALVFFIGVSITSNYAFASEEDNLLKARRLYKEGDYEGAVQILSDFIDQLKAIVAQKKNVAEAFYLMAKVYYTVGDDQKVEENLKKVFETFPTFSYDEADYDFKNRVDTARKLVMAQQGREVAVPQEAEVKQEEPVVEEEVVQPKQHNVITSPPKKKKKKFPVLLVVGGVVLIAVLAVVLLGGKKDDKDNYDIRGNWILNEEWPRFGSFTTYATFTGGPLQGTFRNNDGMSGTYTVTGNKLFFSYDGYEKWEYRGSFTSSDNLVGTGVVLLEDGDEVRGAFTGRRGGQGANTASHGSRPLSNVVKNKK